MARPWAPARSAFSAERVRPVCLSPGPGLPRWLRSLSIELKCIKRIYLCDGVHTSPTLFPFSFWSLPSPGPGGWWAPFFFRECTCLPLAPHLAVRSLCLLLRLCGPALQVLSSAAHLTGARAPVRSSARALNCRAL